MTQCISQIHSFSVIIRAKTDKGQSAIVLDDSQKAFDFKDVGR